MVVNKRACYNTKALHSAHTVHVLISYDSPRLAISDAFQHPSGNVTASVTNAHSATGMGNLANVWLLCQELLVLNPLKPSGYYMYHML
jgi:hypothetical protein